MQINISVNGKERVLQVLQDISANMGNLKPAMRKIGDLVKNSSKGNFKAQTAPDGTPWAPLSAATLLNRARKAMGSKGLYTKGKKDGTGKRPRTGVLKAMYSAQILLDNGVLRNSINVENVTDSSVTVASRLKYSAIHQFGGKAGRGRKVTIPARPYIGIKPDDMRDITDILRSHVLRYRAGDRA